MGNDYPHFKLVIIGTDAAPDVTKRTTSRNNESRDQSEEDDEDDERLEDDGAQYDDGGDDDGDHRYVGCQRKQKDHLW